MKLHENDFSTMTLIPQDTKDVKGPSEDGYPAPPPQATTNPFPNPILQNQSYSSSDFDSEHPPPYTPTDSLSSSTRDLPPAPETRQPELFLGPSPASASSARIPESNAISANSPVNLTGPLRVLGAVKSSSSVSLQKNVFVEGKVSASSWILLEDDVTVEGKVDSSSKITLKNRVKVAGKVNASSSIV
jgi:hypothetical protein